MDHIQSGNVQELQESHISMCELKYPDNTVQGTDTQDKLKKRTDTLIDEINDNRMLINK